MRDHWIGPDKEFLLIAKNSILWRFPKMSRIFPITLPGKTINWRRVVRLTNDGLSSPLAINGPDEERIAAASILCGASLIHGWNVQVTSIYKNLWFESLNLDYLAIHCRVDDVRNIDNSKICGYVQAWEIYIRLLDAWKWFLSRKCFVECMKKFQEKISCLKCYC